MQNETFPHYKYFFIKLIIIAIIERAIAKRETKTNT